MLIISLQYVSQIIKNWLISKIYNSFNCCKQSFGFWLTIDWPNYRSIGLRSNILYDLFIVYWSYTYLIRNVSTKFWSINDHMHTFDHQFIDKLNQPFNIFTFILNIRQKSNYFQPFYDIIIYMIYWLSSDKNLIIITGKSLKFSFQGLLPHLQLSKNCWIELLFNLSTILPFIISICCLVIKLWS